LLRIADHTSGHENNQLPDINCIYIYILYTVYTQGSCFVGLCRLRRVNHRVSPRSSTYEPGTTTLVDAAFLCVG
jgi:hypothetical protein